MLGIFGKTISIEQNNSGLFETLLIQMEELYHKRQDFKSKYFINSLVYFDFQDQYPFHFVSEKLEVWIYGDPLVDGLTGATAMERTIKIVESSYPDISKWSKVDGLFNIIINDKITSKLYLINDRNGLAHLYYGVFKDQLVWGSELRFFINKQQKNYY